MSKQSFEAILEKYLAGNCSSEEVLLVEQWYDLIGNEAKIPDNDMEWQAIKSRMWLEINKENKIDTKNPFKFSNIKIGMAASLFLLLAFVFYFSKYQSLGLKKGFTTKYENKSNSLKKITLSDGSIITLEPNAIVSLSQKFNVLNREVELIGKAKFEVKKDAKKPFLVHANTLITKVVGTVFTINANLNNVQVAVLSGKVSVYKQTDFSQDLKHKHQGVVINPNQQLNFSLENEKFEKTISDAPKMLSTISKSSFNYTDTPASEVFEELKEAYGVVIIYDELILKKCPITADISEESLFQKLFIVCKAIEANYETIDGQIIVNSDGCK